MKKASSAAAQVLVFLATLSLQVYGLVQNRNEEDCFAITTQHSLSFNLTREDADLLDYVTVNSTDRDCQQKNGVLVLIPDLTFDCYGSVLSWSGVIYAEQDSQIPELEMEMHFQVWRPLTGQGDSFDLVGSDVLVFDSSDFTELLTNDTSSNSYYAFEEKEGNSSSDTSEGIMFQPGDVVGCYIPGVKNSGGTASVQAPGFAFRDAILQDELGVDMMVYGVSADVCEVFSCSKTPTMYSSVVPLVYPHVFVTDMDAEYEQVGSGFSGMYDGNSSSLLCPEILECTDEPPCNTDNPGIRGLFLVIAAACIALACIIALVCNITTVCTKHKNTRRARRTRLLLRANRLEARCPFIFRERFSHLESRSSVEQPVLENLTSLADFLQYSMHKEADSSDSNRMSWV